KPVPEGTREEPGFHPASWGDCPGLTRRRPAGKCATPGSHHCSTGGGHESAMSEREPILDEVDVRAVVRLLGEAAGSGQQVVARRRRLMRGGGALPEAEGGLWPAPGVKDRRPICCALLHGGLNERQLAAWAESTQTVDPPLPEHDACEEIARNRYHATRT